jgi:hypothetical protein
VKPIQLNNPAWCACVCAILYGIFLLVRLAVLDFDASSFIVAGEFSCDVDSTPPSLTVRPDMPSYDGLTYYRLALDPFNTDEQRFGIVIDAYRHQRILYPLTVWLVSLGRDSVVPALLILVNYLGLIAMTLLAGKIAQDSGVHALWGLVFPLYPGFALSLARDLTEIMAATLLLGALLLMRRHRHLWAAILLSLALLTRETVLLVAVAALLCSAVARVQSPQCRGWQWYLLPLAVKGAWSLILRALWGVFPSELGSVNIGLPFAAILRFALRVITLDTPTVLLALIYFLELCFIAVFTVAVIVSIRNSRARSHEKLAWLCFGGLAAVTADPVWTEDWAYMRVLYEFYLCGALILLQSQTKWRIPAFTFGALITLMMLVTRVKWL